MYINKPSYSLQPMLHYADYHLLQFNVHILQLELDFYIYNTCNANKALTEYKSDSYSNQITKKILTKFPGVC